MGKRQSKLLSIDLWWAGWLRPWHLSEWWLLRQTVAERLCTSQAANTVHQNCRRKECTEGCTRTGTHSPKHPHPWAHRGHPPSWVHHEHPQSWTPTVLNTHTPELTLETHTPELTGDICTPEFTMDRHPHSWAHQGQTEALAYMCACTHKHSLTTESTIQHSPRTKCQLEKLEILVFQEKNTFSTIEISS